MLDVCAIPLSSGAHSNPDEGMCVMEMTSYIAREQFSDRPACVSGGIAAIMRRVNDSLNDDLRQQLKPYAWRVVGTRTGARYERRRAFLLADWAVRTVLPQLFTTLGRSDLAKLAADVPEVVDVATARHAESVAQQLRVSASAAASVSAASVSAYAASVSAAASASAASAAAYAASVSPYAASVYAAACAADAAASAACAASAASVSVSAYAARVAFWTKLMPSFLLLLDKTIAVSPERSQ